jgi:hypothetical protein
MSNILFHVLYSVYVELGVCTQPQLDDSQMWCRLSQGLVYGGAGVACRVAVRGPM